MLMAADGEDRARARGAFLKASFVSMHPRCLRWI